MATGRDGSSQTGQTGRSEFNTLDAMYADMMESMNRFNREFERLQNQNFGALMGDDSMFLSRPFLRPMGRTRFQPLTDGDFTSQTLALPGSRDYMSPRSSRTGGAMMPFRSMFENTGPRMDVRDDADKVVVHGDVPGMDKESLRIVVEKGILRISGEQQNSKVEENNSDTSKFYLKERSSSSFSRAFSLPDNVIEDGIKAKLNNGVLEIVIPKDTKAIQHHSKAIAIE